MSNYCDEEEAYEAFGVEKVDGLEEGELLAIEKEYSRRQLIESLVGPVISTGFHVLLIILMAIFIIDTVKNPDGSSLMHLPPMRLISFIKFLNHTFIFSGYNGTIKGRYWQIIQHILPTLLLVSSGMNSIVLYACQGYWKFYD